MESIIKRTWPVVLAVGLLAAAALGWPHLRRAPAVAAAAFAPLPPPSAAAAAALGYPAAMDDASRYLCLTGKKVALLGDSQVFHVHDHLGQLLGGCETVKRGSRCGDADYMRLSPDALRELWAVAPPVGSDGDEGPGAVPGTPLPADDEGPAGYGLANLGHGCRDCSGVS